MPLTTLINAGEEELSVADFGTSFSRSTNVLTGKDPSNENA